MKNNNSKPENLEEMILRQGLVPNIPDTEWIKIGEKNTATLEKIKVKA